MKTIEIKKLDTSHSKELSTLLFQSDKNYSKYFIPFSFDLESINAILKEIKKDMFFGFFINNNLVGFHMLRGWDAGYEIPSYGVFISYKYSGLGLGKISLQHAISICHLNKTNKIMLKVHPENLIAKKLYELSGFVNLGIDSKNNHLIYFKDL